MEDVVIASAARTPIGNFGGVFKDVSAVDLGKIAALAAMERAGIKPEGIDEVIIGCVLSAGLGQNVSRQITLGAGLPYTTPAMTVDKVCGSGLRTVTMAAQFIKLGEADIILAGGTENMSQAPFLLPKGRWGQRMGDGNIIDMMVRDGLWDVFNNYHMGVTAENIADEWNISRVEQDMFAYTSQKKAEIAQKTDRFQKEIAPVLISNYKGETLSISKDEYPRHGTTLETLAKLKPAFKKGGSVTAGNASGINDGAAMLIVMSRNKADELGISPLATVKSYASAALDPKIMGYGVVPAVRKALKKANLKIDDIELAELNEAFAAQSLAVVKDICIDPAKVNMNGGAIALGHPIGASGARILVSLLYEMVRMDVKLGIASLCVGGGQGEAIIVKR